MKKFLSLTLLAMFFSFASFALGPITGSNSCCTGGMGYVVDSTHPGGVWTSGNTAIATVSATTGASCTVYGVSAGVVTLTYTLGTYITYTFTVYPTPSPIAGAGHVCVGSNHTLSNSVPGGTWSSSSPYYATVNPTTGTVYGVHSGTAYIYYTTGGSCNTLAVDTVLGSTPTAITGPTSVCASGGTITLHDSLAGGVWSSSNTALATINSSGVVYGVTVGTVTITYTVSSTCGTSFVTYTVNVINTTSPGTLSGATSVTIGANTTLHSTVTGGAWTSSNTSIATINATSGVVTGVTAGTVVMTYTVSGCGGTAYATYTMTVTPFGGISGRVYFPGAPYYGYGKVWLITYNPGTHLLEAIDSVMIYPGGSSVPYQFLTAATDSYRVKAWVYDTIGVTTGYIPTYHTSNHYWYAANVINHTSGTADINQDIYMTSGTPTTGPGFIAGNVTTGANKGTTLGVPVVGMSINVMNASTNQLMQSVRTDASGNYSFSNLPVGATYYVFPDSLNYRTTAYASISLTTGAPNMSAASFIQHTVSMTITPITEAVNNVNGNASSVFAFPNPTNGKLNLQWNVNTGETGNVVITDITGRQVYKSIINMTAGTGVKQIDLSGFVNGLYMITVKSASVNYNSKIQIQK